jgi:hypothetical protein
MYDSNLHLDDVARIIVREHRAGPIALARSRSGVRWYPIRLVSALELDPGVVERLWVVHDTA